MISPSRRALSVRGSCAGALGGLAAALLDYGLSRGEAARFLPSGSLRLLMFLVALYGAVAALGGMAAGWVSRALGWATDLGPIASTLFPQKADIARRKSPYAATTPALSGRLIAFLAAAPVVLALHGLAIYPVALTALQRFHAHLPIAALDGAAAALLAIPSVVMLLLVGGALSAAIRKGPRLRLVFGTPKGPPLGWIACFWLSGLGAGAFGVLLESDALQLRRRTPPTVQALQLAIWAPAIVAAALVGAHVLGRLAWRWFERLSPEVAKTLRPWLAHPAGALAAVVLVAASVLYGGITSTWAVAKLINWKPLAVAAVGILGAGFAAAGGIGASWDGRKRWQQIALVVALPSLLLLVAHRSGGSDRTRKAAFATALGPSLVTAVQSVTDLDRDGYPSTLGFGSDCDDHDREVHPGAFDWPDDGIDQNCNGHQATAQATARAPFPAVPPSVPRRLNVVLISIDALRADHVGAYGYARHTTPVLDAVAKDGVLFQNGWAHSPSTRYSVPAILIGRYESTIAWDPRAHWPPLVLPENRLMSEMFKERGYHTAALVPAHYFEPGWGLNQGFDDYDWSLSRLHANPFGGDPARTTGSSSRELADLGIEWLKKHTDAFQPFFLWMHFYDPHYLYERHPDVEQFGDSDIDLYDGEVRYTDLHVGRLLDAIKAAGEWDRTVVILTADHGEGFGEHGVKQHGYHIYAQQNKVPFIVRVPGIAPRSVEEPVGHIDLFPSLLNLIGAPDEPQLLGRSFVDLMLGASTPRLVFGEVEYEGPVVRKSVASSAWHLIHNVTPDDTFELYHLTNDPQEEHDLDDTGAPEEASLKAALAEWMDQSALPPHFAERVAGNISSSPLPSRTPLGARVGDLLVVDGVDVASSQIERGGVVDVAVVLHVLRPTDGWRLFTHVRGPQNHFVNADHEPVEGFVPLARLKPGQYVRDRIRVTLPPDWPPGPLTVEIGLWKGPARAPVSTGGDFVKAATLEVRP